jgi:D-aspartate ligase
MGANSVAAITGEPTPVLLLSGGFYGSLAAARCLGRAGIPVTVADKNRFTPTAWSRYVTARETCPSEQDPDALLDWLCAFGRRSRRHVLYPTSDDTAFLISQERERLSQWFDLYSPPVETVYALLNKKHLFAHARDAGLEMPKAWFPSSEAALGAIANTARGPLMVKPATQVFFPSHRKGVPVTTLSELEREWSSYGGESYARRLMAFDPAAAQPLVQRYMPEAMRCVLSLSGFIDQSGEHFVVRASRKLLQFPRRLGVGVAYEAAEVDQELADKIRVMCLSAGFHGVFEAEFIPARGQKLLIDFNPRFYGQMGFDIARGVPLPLFVYHGALGQTSELAYLVSQVPDDGADSLHYTNRLAAMLMLGSQRISGALSHGEWKEWKAFVGNKDLSTVDAVLDREDWLPTPVELAQEVWSFVRHPRSFVRRIVLNRP